MSIDPEYVVRSLIEIKERVASISEQMEENKEHLAEVKLQTEALKLEIKEFREFSIQTRFFTKLVVGLGSFVIIALGLILSIIKFTR